MRHTKTQTAQTPVNCWEHLELLRVELHNRGWHAHHRGTRESPVLHVRNPWDAGYNDSVTVMDGCYAWRWGVEISPIGQPDKAAERVMHLLRVVAP